MTPKAFAWRNVSDQLQAAMLPKRVTENQKRFESLSVAQTGIDFGHDWVPPPEYKLEIYNSLPGGGVCVGDYDGDHWPDVFLTQPNVGSRLYRNLGGLRFEDVTDSTVGENPFAQGATFVDIDNDGDLDLYVCNDERPNQLFVNLGNGQFQDRASEFGLDFIGASVMMAFADYDLDGDLDGYLVTNRAEAKQQIPRPHRNTDGSYEIPEEHREFVDVIVAKDGQPRIIKAAQDDHLYRNNGDGTFSDISQAAGVVGNYWGLAATWWDYDRDGWPDLYVSNDFYSPDQLYHNNGDGSFTDVASSSLPHTPWYSMGTDVADVNNDGWFDLMGSDMSATNHYKQKASMGDMSTTSWFLTHPTPRQYMRNALYLNTGTDRFMEIAQLAGVANTDWTWSLKFADMDEDGWSDLFVTNGMNRDWTNTDLRNRSNRAETEDERIQIWINSPQRRDTNLAFRNSSDLRFENVSAEWGLGDERVSYGAAFADLDRDGDLDLIVNNAEEAARVYRNNTAQTHRVVIGLRGTESNRWGLGATVSVATAGSQPNHGSSRPSQTQVKYLTSTQGYMSSNEPVLHFGLGEASSIERLEIRWPKGHLQVFDDLPADRYYLITETTSTDAANSDLANNLEDRTPAPLFEAVATPASTKHKETPFNDFARQPLLPNQLSQLGPGLAVGDVDGDDDVDVFVGGASGQPGRLLVNQDGQLTVRIEQCWQTDAHHEDMGVLFFDADGDGDLDLYVVSGGVECEPGDDVLQDRLYLNDAHGVFAAAPDELLPDLRDSGSTVAAADFDRDGDLDLFVGGRVVPGHYPLAPKSHLLRNDGGRYVDIVAEQDTGLAHTGLVTGAVWSDTDGDGWVDLVVAHEWGPVKLYRNREGHLSDASAEAGLAGRIGWWNSVVPSDVDCDGDPDYVVGNWGWNTKYHASDEEPSLLYYGDFERSGRMRLVEAEYEDETLFPVRGKSCSTGAMPFLGNKFQKFHDFAVASLEEIYTPDCLEQSHRFAANRLETGIWINDGTGRFEFHALPTLAQASPTFGIVPGHFNDDGYPDLFLAQNFFGPQAETGRADGGVGMLWLGQGDGTFTPLPPHQSGIVVPDDATAACFVDLVNDGRSTLLVATNDGPLHRFDQSMNLPGRVIVRLQGGKANRSAVGAQVVALFSNGMTQSAEVTCGSGYLSQAPADLSFVVPAEIRLQQLTVAWPTGESTTLRLNGEPPLPDEVILLTQPSSDPLR